MKRFSFILISILALSTFTAGAQCVSVRSNTTICQGTTLSILGGSMLRGTTSTVWSDNGAGGTFSPGVSTLNATWTPLASYTGKVTLTLTSTAGCNSTIKTASFTVTVTPLPAATISYAGTPFCKRITTAQPVTRTGTSGGRYSSTTGLTINSSSGAITPSTSTSGTYTVTYSIAAAGGCGIVTATTSVVIAAIPTAPVIAFITQPSCASNTGIVALTGLPANNNWVLTSNPNGSISSGNGTVTTFSGLSSGSYTFIVTTANNCTSVPSNTAVINAQPPTPSAPVVGTITPSKCSDSNGSVQFSGLPASGTWTLTRSPGGIATNGSGPGTTITRLAAGTYSFTVTNSYGCISTPSADVVINTQPASPSAPVIGTVSQPTCSISTGSAVLSGLPGTDTWTITRNPDGVLITGTGTTTTISTILAGTYTFIVTNSGGCSSVPSASVLINQQPLIPQAPSVGAITSPGCALPTGSVVLSGLPSSGTWTIIRYPGTISTSGSGTSSTITGLQTGTYNFTVTTIAGCLSAPSSNVVIPTQPVPPDPPVVGTITQPTDMVPTGSVILNGLPATGTWVITGSPGGSTTNGTGSSQTISGLEGGIYTFTVTNSSGCTSVSDTVRIVVHNQIIPTLITPNMDGKNDYFVLKDLSIMGKTELYIFDRRGVSVYKNLNYNNKWNGVDYNDKPLPDDTYFYLIRTQGGRYIKGYIVIRK